jgi:hypothetical protein
MAKTLKQSEKFMYNWTNRTVQDFAKAIAPEPAETKAVVDVTPSTNVTLNTVANKTIFNLGTVDGNLVNNITVTLGNPGEQEIGDTLILMLTGKAGSTNINVTFDNIFFHHQTTGSQRDYLPTISGGEKSVTIFTFDGEKFVCTNDNG